MHEVCLHEHDILSILLLRVNVSGVGSLLSRTVLTHTAGFIARVPSQETASSGEVRAKARSDLGRWRFWLFKWPTWNV